MEYDIKKFYYLGQLDQLFRIIPHVSLSNVSLFIFGRWSWVIKFLVKTLKKYIYLKDEQKIFFQVISIFFWSIFKDKTIDGW